MSAGAYFADSVRCADGSLYVGHTSDVEDRVKVHNEGRGALWTACRRPVILVYQEAYPTEGSAITRERQLKRWTHAKKVALIDGNVGQLKALAKRHLR